MSARSLVFTQQVELEMITETCCQCGVVFAMTRELYDHLQKKKQAGEFYCPNGHNQHYVGESDAQKLKKANEELARERQRREMAEREAAMEKARAEKAETKGARVAKRVKNGVCPCCNRSFQNLRRHMATKHPEHPSP